MVFQHFNLIKAPCVLENVIAGRLGSLPILQSLWENFPHMSVMKSMEKLAIVGLADKTTSRADAPSGGQQQRVAIARTLMQKPNSPCEPDPLPVLTQPHRTQ